jgi:4-hydroxy-tetrahydrodipicolinate synthase
MAELKTISSAKLRLPLCEEEISAQHGLHYIHQQIQQWLENNSSYLLAQHHASDSFFNAVATKSLATTNLQEINQ